MFYLIRPKPKPGSELGQGHHVWNFVGGEPQDDEGDRKVEERFGRYINNNNIKYRQHRHHRTQQVKPMA